MIDLVNLHKQVLLGFPRHYKFCLYLSSFCTGVFIVSLFALLAVSIDRFWAVCYPLTYHVRDANLAKAGIAVCWIFGLALGSLPVLGWNSGQWDGLCDYRVITDLNYLLFMCALTFTPAMTIIVLYVLIYREIMNQVRTIFGIFFVFLFCAQFENSQKNTKNEKQNS